VSAPVVVGGLGVSGLGCALELARRGIPFVALEKETRPGGLARSESLDGFRFDYGPHIVLGVPAELQGLMDDLPGLDLQPCSGRSCVALDGRLRRVVPVPFQQHLNHLPLAVRARALLELAGTRRTNGRRPASYGEFAIARCGRSVYELFLRGYESKRLRYALDEIPPDWTERVPEPSLRSLVRPRWTSRTVGNGAAESRFLYPRAGGIEALPRGLARLLPPGSVRCHSEIVEIDARMKRLTLQSGRTMSYEQLVLSLPLPEVIARLKDPPGAMRAAAQDLVHTSIYAISFGVEGPIEVPWTLIRLPGNRHPFYRVSFPSRYAPDNALQGHEVVVVETSHHPARHQLAPDEALREGRRGLTDLGVLRPGQRIVVETVRDIPYGHVVHNHRTRASIRLVLDYLSARSISTCGKYGLWKDMLMTGSILSGMEAARRIADGVETAQKKRSISVTA
jgi:protoporphyrinogen oxidase